MQFAGGWAITHLVAHNASFDKRFLDAELQRVSLGYGGQFSCSMLAARRIFQQAPDHKLGTLIQYMNIPVEGVFHRALYDSQMTGKLWLAMLEDVQRQYVLSKIDFKLMQKLARTPKHAVDSFWQAACKLQGAAC